MHQKPAEANNTSISDRFSPYYRPSSFMIPWWKVGVTECPTRSQEGGFSVWDDVVALVKRMKS